MRSSTIPVAGPWHLSMRNKHLLVRVADHARNTLIPSPLPLSFLYPSLAPLHTPSKRFLRSTSNSQDPHYSPSAAELVDIEDEELSERPSSSRFTFYRNAHLPPPTNSLTVTSSANKSSTANDIHADIERGCQQSIESTDLVRKCHHLLQRCSSSDTDRACATIVLCSRHLIDTKETLLAASVVQSMLDTVGWSTSTDVVPHVDRLIMQLSLHHDKTLKTRRGFASPAHYEAAIGLFSSMRRAGISAPPKVQTALLRAMLRSRMQTRAVRFYAAQVDAWWQNKAATRPSAQTLREIRQSLTFAEQWLADSRCKLQDKVIYAQSLVVLCRLLTTAQLPVPEATSPADLVWIISACCRFEKSISLAAISPEEKQHAVLQDIAETIRNHMTDYLQSLPSGDTDSEDLRPPLDMHSYNQLIHYSMAVLRSSSLCKHVFGHMLTVRTPPLVPDVVTFNTILRQAAVSQNDTLAHAVLTTEQQFASNALQQHSDGAQEDAQLTLNPPGNPMLVQADLAIARADSHRLAALTQYITASNLFMPRNRHELGYVAATDWIMRVYPALDKYRSSRRGPAATNPEPPVRIDPMLRPAADRAGRLTILNPHVLTSMLNLAAKAGRTGLALRVWRLLKRTSLQSSPQLKRNDVADYQWSVPVQAATIILQLLAKETLRVPDVQGRSARTLSVVGSRSSGARRRALVSHGWNLAASTSRFQRASRRVTQSLWRYDVNSPRAVGEGMRWIAARLLIQREYMFLLDHWGLSSQLGQYRQERLSAWQQGRPCPSPPRVRQNKVRPDARFFSLVLSIFGYQHPYFRRYSRLPFNHAAFQSGGVETEAGQFEADPTPLVNLLHTVAAGVSRAALEGEQHGYVCDPFLLLVLLDAEALHLPVPPEYHWILAQQLPPHAAPTQHDNNDVE